MSDFFTIKPRTRKILDTGHIETDQALQPFTGTHHSGSAMSSAVQFYMAHDHPSWHDDAVCRDMPQEIFYGKEDRTGKARHHPSLTVDEVAKARAICNTCPVQLECLRSSIVNREEFGIWGGSTAGQRKQWIKTLEEQQNLGDETYNYAAEEWDQYHDGMTG